MTDDLKVRLRYYADQLRREFGPEDDQYQEAADMDAASVRIEALEAALAEREAEVAFLRAALTEIADRHIPDQPAGFGGDEL